MSVYAQGGEAEFILDTDGCLAADNSEDTLTVQTPSDPNRFFKTLTWYCATYDVYTDSYVAIDFLSTDGGQCYKYNFLTIEDGSCVY